MASPPRTFDVVVVGSGYGGAIAACRLAQAGLSVCVLEKGKRWEPRDFPTNVWQLLSTMRFHTGFGSFGRKNSLYEVYVDGDSLAVTASGLGGGSLVNAGVIMPTPRRARRDPRWPEEWDRDWDEFEAKAQEILQPESVPHDFPKTQIMDKLVEDIEDMSRVPVKLTMTFSSKKSVAGAAQDACVACGNCLTGCSYNAKSSTDKNYIQLAAQAGAQIYTEREVLFVSQSPKPTSSHFQAPFGKAQSRRWRVHENSVDYISADYVVLSAGVLGTTGILLRSKERGLQLSEKLGSGVSCNGNNIAFVTEASAQTQVRGLGKEKFPSTPLPLRPGPSISSSHTSSLGFTIQASAIPKASSYVILKGILINRWPVSWGIIHALWDQFMQWITRQNIQELQLNLISYDSGDGHVTLNEKSGKITYQASSDLLFCKKLERVKKIASKLDGKLFLPRFRSNSVHLLGGCNVSTSITSGVTSPSGQVYAPPASNQANAHNSDERSNKNVHAGLYICDASVIPCSIGVNPVGTIAIVAEKVSSCIAKDAKYYLFSRRESLSSLEHPVQDEPLKTSKVTVVNETLDGSFDGIPCTLKLTMHIVSKTTNCTTILHGQVGGKLLIPLLEKDPLHVLDGYVNLCSLSEKSPFTQFMRYHLLLSTSSGRRFLLMAKKEMRPFLCGLWIYKESTTLNAQLVDLSGKESANPSVLQGTLHVSVFNLLRSLISLKGPGKFLFLKQLLSSLLQTYFSGRPRRIDQPSEVNVRTENEVLDYPSYVHHEMQTKDGAKITCKQWPLPMDQKKGLVLLLNGYSTESFCLPTEPQDMVRTLLQNGYEVWLLQTRVHPSHPGQEKFDLDDIAKFDIPAAFERMEQSKNGPACAHVIAHCIGGLLIHMAIMGGHLPVSRVASLVCTNSSMFFSLVPSALVKMALPLIPISMKILGDHKTLPITNEKREQKLPTRHKLIRAIARAIPRTECCVSDECSIFSGIFGNTFWHENVRKEVHDWLVSQAVPVLPLQAFPHLRKIARAGHIVDARGQETYMTKPERLALPTTYISGGKPILATPQMSEQAHEFMKKHHPTFDHARFVITSYGHSDLWIGESSHTDIFPLIIERLRSVEKDPAPERREANRRRNLPLPWAIAPARARILPVGVALGFLMLCFAFKSF